jgi:hypothetical protein
MWSRPCEGSCSSPSQAGSMTSAVGPPKRLLRSGPPSMSLQTFCARDNRSPIQWSAWRRGGHRRRGSRDRAAARGMSLPASQRPRRSLLCRRRFAGSWSFHRKDSIEIFIRALSEDEVRLTAEAILRGFGLAERCAPLSSRPQGVGTGPGELRYSGGSGEMLACDRRLC